MTRTRGVTALEWRRSFPAGVFSDFVAPDKGNVFFSALSLLMALVFAADNHNFAVSLDDSALIAHGSDGRSYFHRSVSFFVSLN